MSPTTKPPPRTCPARVCRHCRTLGMLRPRALTTDDLRWFYGEAESALGIRSTLGAFVDMALSGITGGGKSNGVENRAVEQRRLDATGRERCIRHRLDQAPSAAREVLRIAYGPDDWSACHSQVELRRGGAANPLTAPEVHAAVRRAFGPEVLRLAPLTALAQSYAHRKRAAPAPTPRPRRDAPGDVMTPRQAVGGLLDRDPLLARSPRAAVLLAACGVCPGCGGTCEAVAALHAQARDLLTEARRAACVVDTSAARGSRIRSAHNPPPPAHPEPGTFSSDAEVWANG